MVGDGLAEMPEQPVVFEPDVDKAGAGNFARQAEVGHVEAFDDFGGDVAGRLFQCFGQRHGAVGLIVAELGVLAREDHLGQIGRIVGQSFERCDKSVA